MLIGRFVPIVAPVALAGGLILKKPTPFTVGTLRTDSSRSGCSCWGRSCWSGRCCSCRRPMLGPVAEHFGPIPFGN